MSKCIFSLIVVILGLGIVPVSAHAVATPPSATIWVTPSDAKSGDDIVLNAFVYNSTTSEATATVVFTHGADAQAKSIGSSIIVVPATTAKAATVTWKMPATSILVTATVTTAVTKTKKDIPALVGVLGSTTIGGMGTIALPDLGGVKGWIGTALEKIEAFRIKKAEHYAAVLKESKGTVNNVARKDIADLLVPENTNTPTPTTEGQTLSVGQKTDHTAAYANVVFATAANSFFAHKAAFYISIIIVLLFLLKFIFGRFL